MEARAIWSKDGFEEDSTLEKTTFNEGTYVGASFLENISSDAKYIIYNAEYDGKNEDNRSVKGLASKTNLEHFYWGGGASGDTPYTSIKENAFKGCSSLRSVTLVHPSKYTIQNGIGKYAFSGCNLLCHWNTWAQNIDDIADWNKDKDSINPPENSDMPLIVRGGIEEHAFEGTGLGVCIPYVEINKKGTSPAFIGDYAFQNSTAPVEYKSDGQSSKNTKVSIKLGTGVFKKARISPTIINSFDYGLTNKIPNYCYEECEFRALTKDGTVANNQITYSLILNGENYAEIGQGAFKNCKYLTTVDLSATKITTICAEAFYGCESLIEVRLPDTLQWIDESAFYNCKKLSSITFPKTIQFIGNEAFAYCSNLGVVNFTDETTTPLEIGTQAFMHCRGLSSVNFRNNIVASIGRQAFDGCDSLQIVGNTRNLDPQICVNAHIYVGYQAFYNCISLKSLKFKQFDEETQTQVDSKYPVVQIGKDSKGNYGQIIGHDPDVKLRDTYLGVHFKGPASALMGASFDMLRSIELIPETYNFYYDQDDELIDDANISEQKRLDKQRAIILTQGLMDDSLMGSRLKQIILPSEAYLQQGDNKIPVYLSELCFQKLTGLQFMGTPEEANSALGKVFSYKGSYNGQAYDNLYLSSHIQYIRHCAMIINQGEPQITQFVSYDVNRHQEWASSNSTYFRGLFDPDTVSYSNNNKTARKLTYIYMSSAQRMSLGGIGGHKAKFPYLKGICYAGDEIEGFNLMTDQTVLQNVQWAFISPTLRRIGKNAFNNLETFAGLGDLTKLESDLARTIDIATRYEDDDPIGYAITYMNNITSFAGDDTSGLRWIPNNLEIIYASSLPVTRKIGANSNELANYFTKIDTSTFTALVLKDKPDFLISYVPKGDPQTAVIDLCHLVDGDNTTTVQNIAGECLHQLIKDQQYDKLILPFVGSGTTHADYRDQVAFNTMDYLIAVNIRVREVEILGINKQGGQQTLRGWKKMADIHDADLPCFMHLSKVEKFHIGISINDLPANEECLFPHDFFNSPSQIKISQCLGIPAYFISQKSITQNPLSQSEPFAIFTQMNFEEAIAETDMSLAEIIFGDSCFSRVTLASCQLILPRRFSVGSDARKSKPEDNWMSLNADNTTHFSKIIYPGTISDYAKNANYVCAEYNPMRHAKAFVFKYDGVEHFEDMLIIPNSTQSDKILIGSGAFYETKFLRSIDFQTAIGKIYDNCVGTNNSIMEIMGNNLYTGEITIIGTEEAKARFKNFLSNVFVGRTSKVEYTEEEED